MKKFLIWMRVLLSTALACLVVFAYSPAVFAFCGFYVSQADASLFNKRQFKDEMQRVLMKQRILRKEYDSQVIFWVCD